MPCSQPLARFRRAVLPLALVALGCAAEARPQQEANRPTAQQALENSIDRWNRMPPAERERELAKLPPARARLIRQRLWWYNHLPPEEQQELRERYQTFSQLPPDQQSVVRARLREFRQLPTPRRGAVHREVERLRSLPQAQREVALNGELQGRFSPQELQIIRDLATYLPN